MKIILFLLLTSVASYSLDLSSYGLEIIGREENNIVLESVDGYRIDVVTDGDLTPVQEELIISSYTTIISWEELKIKNVRIILEGNKINIIILPQSLIYMEEDLSEFMPSGMQFYYEKFFEYDFRMLKDSLFMRLKGQYFSKEEFLEDIYNAVQDPILYIQIHDPSYLIRQIDKLRDDNNNQDKNIFTLDEDLTDLASKHEELLQRHEDLLNNYQALLEDHEKLKKEKDELNSETSKLIATVISLNNRNFFGFLNPHDQAVVDKTVEVKKANMELDVKGVMAKLKALGLKPQTRMVESVFMIYFGEFPQNK